MNEARFVELLGVYGADLVRWPEEDRGSAAAFLEIAPHRIKDIWESERTFDHLLAHRSLIGASPGLSLWSLPKWAKGGALAASLALGFAVGYAGEPPRSAETDYASMLTISSSGGGSMYLTAINDGGH
jgi:hypothetical protein